MATLYCAAGITHGDGDGSYNDPISVSASWTMVTTDNRHFVLKDGTYSAFHDIIDNFSHRFEAGVTHPENGSSGNPIVFEAENYGQVHMEQTDAVAIRILNQSYITIKGINAKGGEAGGQPTIHITGTSVSNIILQQCIGIGAVLTNQAPVIGINDNAGPVLVEDSFFFGTARKMVEASIDVSNVTFRRVVGYRHGGQHAEPNNVFECGYYSQNCIWENCIGFWNRVSGTAPNPQAVFLSGDPGSTGNDTENNKLLGCVAICLDGYTFDPAQLYEIGDWDTYTLQDCVAYTSKNGVTPFSLYGIQAPDTQPIDFIRGSAQGGNTASSIHADWDEENFDDHSTSGTIDDVWDETKVDGARLRKRYVDGVKTTDDLLPWPMDARIKSALSEEGYPTITNGSGGTDDGTVTTLLETLFGDFPAAADTPDIKFVAM